MIGAGGGGVGGQARARVEKPVGIDCSRIQLQPALCAPLCVRDTARDTAGDLESIVEGDVRRACATGRPLRAARANPAEPDSNIARAPQASGGHPGAMSAEDPAAPTAADEMHVMDAQAALAAALGDCPLSVESLRHPTFSAVVTVLLRLSALGFAAGLFEDQELALGSRVGDEEKQWLLARLFAFVGGLTGQRVAIRPADVMDGSAPEQTLRFVTGLAQLANDTPKEVADVAVARVKEAMAAAEPAAKDAAPGKKRTAKGKRKARSRSKGTGRPRAQASAARGGATSPGFGAGSSQLHASLRGESTLASVATADPAAVAVSGPSSPALPGVLQSSPMRGRGRQARSSGMPSEASEAKDAAVASSRTAAASGAGASARRGPSSRRAGPAAGSSRSGSALGSAAKPSVRHKRGGRSPSRRARKDPPNPGKQRRVAAVLLAANQADPAGGSIAGSASEAGPANFRAGSAASSMSFGSVTRKSQPRSGKAAARAIEIPPAAEEAEQLGGRNLFDREWLGGFDFRLRALTRQLNAQMYGRAEAAPAFIGQIDPPKMSPDSPGSGRGQGGSPEVGGVVSGIGLLSPAQLRSAGALSRGSSPTL